MSGRIRKRRLSLPRPNQAPSFEADALGTTTHVRPFSFIKKVHLKICWKTKFEVQNGATGTLKKERKTNIKNYLADPVSSHMKNLTLN